MSSSCHQPGKAASIRSFNVSGFDFATLFGWGSGGEPVGYSKDLTGAPPAPALHGPSFELSLIAGQFTFYNNNADSPLSFNKTDAFMFETQLLGRVKLFHGLLTIAGAPAVQIWNEAGLGPTSVLPDGKPNPSSVPAGTGTGALGTLNNAAAFPITTRDEFYLQTPAYVLFKPAGLSTCCFTRILPTMFGELSASPTSIGMAASLGAGISMGFSEALSDDGVISGRGQPWIRGGVCGLMTFIFG